MRIVWIICISIVLCGNLTAQQEGSAGTEGDGQSLDDAFLGYINPDIQVQAIGNQVRTHDRNTTFEALDNIESMMQNGTFPEDSVHMLDLVDDLASSGVGYQVKIGGVVINDFPLVRQRACRILGQIGTEEAKQRLYRILANEMEPIVLGEAVLALAQAGANDEQVEEIVFRMNQMNLLKKDDFFADMALQAIEIILVNDPDMLGRHPGLFVEISDIANPSSGYSRTVRTRAARMITILSAAN